MTDNWKKVLMPDPNRTSGESCQEVELSGRIVYTRVEGLGLSHRTGVCSTATEKNTPPRF